MNRNDAINHLRAHPDSAVFFRARDATLSHWRDHSAWLDDDGDLVQSHPTGPGTTAAPDDVEYLVRGAEWHAEQALIAARNDAERDAP